MEDRVTLLLLLSSLACTPHTEPTRRRCVEGEIATVDGCAPLPGWNPWTYDASVRDSGGANDALPIDVGFADAGEPDALEPDAGETINLGGAWALRVVNAQTVSSQLVEPTAVTFTGLSIVRIDRALGVASTPCALESTPFGGTITTWSPAAIAATTVRDERATAQELAIDKPISLSRRQLVGWISEDPNEELPAEADDPRVVDADGDGNPGVTLNVAGNFSGDLYVASVATLSLDGTIVSLDRIEGPSRTDQETELLGASNELLLLGETTSTVIPEASSFQMMRVEEAIDCAQLIEREQQIFVDP